MRSAARRLSSLVLCVAAVSAGGCVAAAVAVGAAAAYGVVKYTDNEAYRDFHSPLDATWRATVEEMHDEGYPVALATDHGPNEGRVDIGDAKVVVERRPDDSTRVRVRIGTFSTDEHRRRAALILEGVAKRVD